MLQTNNSHLSSRLCSEFKYQSKSNQLNNNKNKNKKRRENLDLLLKCIFILVWKKHWEKFHRNHATGDQVLSNQHLTLCYQISAINQLPKSQYQRTLLFFFGGARWLNHQINRFMLFSYFSFPRVWANPKDTLCIQVNLCWSNVLSTITPKWNNTLKK